MSKEAMKLALEALEEIADEVFSAYDNKLGAAILALREALAEDDSVVFGVDRAPAQQEPIHVPVKDNTYGYAKSLAEAIFKRHFASDEHYASGQIVWGVSDTVIGILTQIDNMVADMVRKPAQRKPLTDEEIKLVMDGRGEEGDNDYVKPAFDPFGISEDDLMNFARAIEAKLKEKNT